MKSSNRDSSRRSRIRAVFLDRDGTINVDHGWTWRPEDLRLLPGAAKAVRQLNEAGFLVVVVSNQSGVGRGLYTEADVTRFHQLLNARLAVRHAHIDAFYFCPHHPVEARGRYRRVCRCRKPEPGMLKQAIREFRVDVARSYMIGDSTKDVEAGRRAGLMTIRLVARVNRSGIDYSAPNLLAAARLILSIPPPGARSRRNPKPSARS